MIKRKILIVTNRIPYPLNDGGNLAMNAMINGYREGGWDVYLLAMNTSRHPVDEATINREYGKLAGFATVPINNNLNKVGIITNFVFSRQPNHAVRFSNNAFAEKLKDVVDNFRPDIIQMESVYLATYINALKQYSGALLVLRMHNVEYEIWRRLAKKTSNVFSRWYYNNLSKRLRKFEIHSWKKFDLLLPITDSDASEAGRFGIKTPRLMAPFGIDIRNLAPAVPPDKWVGYHIGAMDWKPNASSMKWFLKTAWPMIRKECPDFEFYFAGRHMPSLFKNMDIEGVHCEGEVPDAGAFIADKNVLIVPLKASGCIRVKILEAMAAGKVIISTRIAMQGIDAHSGDHYLHAHHDKPKDFVKAIRYCLENKEKALEMAERGRQLVISKYDHEAIMATVMSAMERMLTIDEAPPPKERSKRQK